MACHTFCFTTLEFVQIYSFPEAAQTKPIENIYIGVGVCHAFYFTFLEAVQFYLSAEAAQMKLIEKLMYRSGQSVALFYVATCETGTDYSSA